MILVGYQANPDAQRYLFWLLNALLASRALLDSERCPRYVAETVLLVRLLSSLECNEFMNLPSVHLDSMNGGLYMPHILRGQVIKGYVQGWGAEPRKTAVSLISEQCRHTSVAGNRHQ